MSLTSIIVLGAVGATFGLGMLNVMAVMAKRKNNPADIVSLPASAEARQAVEDWAKRQGYRSVRADGATRVYQKGLNLLTSPLFLETEERDGTLTLKAYTEINGLLARGKLALTDPGPMAVLPRKMATKAVNELLTTLRQPTLG